ncbi:MAG: peptidoglycan editing factor PgeF [Sorangiineae bacterium]|nr:peptidoglycan editing factor PgeF [Polyangiaceae bacterium]MEB2322127.1 peptidoglycan editing factor PgeF [Sorangiineae bacterium]
MTAADFETSPLLEASGFRHAFFTRRGGVSTGAYASLSFSTASGDAPDHVSENLARAARALGVAPNMLYFLSQVHGREVLRVRGGEARDEVLRREGDAVVSGDAGVACAVRVADCVPLLVADRASGAVAAAHAGWRGVAAGVAAESVRALRALTGAEGALVAAIGPHISVDAFEVSDEVAQTLRDASPDPDVVRPGPHGRPHVNLRKIIRAQLCEVGLRAQDVDDVGGCTVGDPARYFSFRRDGKASGRHLAAIVAR